MLNPYTTLHTKCEEARDEYRLLTGTRPCQEQGHFELRVLKMFLTATTNCRHRTAQIWEEQDRKANSKWTMHRTASGPRKFSGFHYRYLAKEKLINDSTLRTAAWSYFWLPRQKLRRQLKKGRGHSHKERWRSGTKLKRLLPVSAMRIQCCKTEFSKVPFSEGERLHTLRLAGHNHYSLLLSAGHPYLNSLAT